jgi:hypothetical protein
MEVLTLPVLAAYLDPVGAEDFVEIGQGSLLLIRFPDQAGEEIPD